MIDYNAFHNYLKELVGMYQQTSSTKGMSQLAQKWHCTAITRDQFYQMKLDKLLPEQVTAQLSRVVRDTIGRSEAKQTLRETIGALNEGILSKSRISQGSDSTVQITITQPLVGEKTEAVKHERIGFTGRIPLYRPGQILFRNGGTLLHVSHLLDNDRFTWDYELSISKSGHEHVCEANGDTSLWMNSTELRPAKGNEVARFLGALTRSGYEWTADNANGLFFIRKNKNEQKQVEVFANELPNGYHGIFALPSLAPSPYRFALRCVSCIGNAQQFMAESQQSSVVKNAILRQLDAIDGGQECYGIREYLEYDLPTLCCSEELREHRVAFVKVSGGKSYWLGRDRDVLRLLAWISFIA